MLRRRRSPLRRTAPRLPLLAGVAALIVVFALLWTARTDARGEAARAAAERFYAYEQTGDFGSSWELFHDYMKTKFNKDGYIQTRAHVFMQDFGVTAFEADVGAPQKLNAWRMSRELPALPEVYRIPVTLTYESKFGIFRIVQDVFMTEEHGEWLLLWGYPAE